MSSSFNVLCMSHDPASTVQGFNTPEEAYEAIRNRFQDHPNCDFLISRRAGGAIEIGCPGYITTGSGLYKCLGHPELVWVAVEWLRILACVQDAGDDPQLLKVMRSPVMRCWTPIRLNRLRREL